jgi:hypothetical protein
VGQVIDVTNRTFSVTIDLKNAQGRFKPNLLAMITAYDFKIDSALIVPARLVNIVDDSSFVYVAHTVDQDTVAKRQTVATRLLDNRHVLITSGLEPGSWVIDQGYRSVSDGDKLHITRMN